MKQLFLVAAMAMGAAGCASDLRPIQVGNALPLDGECKSDGDVYQYAGSLDVSWMGKSGVLASDLHFYLNFNVASTLEGTEVDVGDSPVGDPSRNSFIVEQIELSYTSTPAGTYTAESVPAFFVVPAGSQESKMVIDLVTPKALETAAALIGSPDQAVTLNVRFRLKGKMATGATAESNEVSFPITITKRYPDFQGCDPALGLIPLRTGPCGGLGGQDGAPIGCEVPESAQ